MKNQYRTAQEQRAKNRQDIKDLRTKVRDNQLGWMASIIVACILAVVIIVVNEANRKTDMEYCMSEMYTLVTGKVDPMYGDTDVNGE